MVKPLFHESSTFRINEGRFNFILSKILSLRISIENINRLKFLFLPIVALIAPVLLVVMQPDLGTAILIASGGVVVAWLAGVRAKFFAYSLLLFICLL